jgi:hypothetical protein
MTTAANKPALGVVRSMIPARLHQLPWSPFHTRMVVALGVAWILEGLEITVASAVADTLTQPETLGLSSAAVGLGCSRSRPPEAFLHDTDPRACHVDAARRHTPREYHLVRQLGSTSGPTYRDVRPGTSDQNLSLPGIPQVPNHDDPSGPAAGRGQRRLLDTDTADMGHPRVIAPPTQTTRVGGRVPRPGGL